MSNENWPRWIFASVCKHFNTLRGDLPLFIEGQLRETEGVKDFIELRVDGPDLTEVSKGYWRAYNEINVLVQSAQDESDFHRIHRNVGLVAQMFTNIQVFRYGNGVDDTSTLLGCMKLINDFKSHEKIQIAHFGKVDAATPLLQATVEGHYEMFIEER